MHEVTLEVPVPHHDLAPNSRCHWANRARRTRQCRRAVALLAMNEYRPDKPHANMRIKCCWDFPTKRKRDKSNLTAWLKATIDGLVDAGWVEDDQDVIVDGDHMVRHVKGCEPTVRMFVEFED